VLLLEDVAVARIETGGGVARAIAPGARFAADRMVVAAGAWSAALLPFLAGRVTVLRQTVGYFRLPPRTFDPAAFPIWAYLGKERNDFYYGLPQLDGDGVKAARHRTLGEPDDPDASGEPSPAAIEDLERVLERVFAAPPEMRAGAETCLYGVTATEDFAIGLHPDHPRIAFGAGFSGHGFKFGPLTGRILAELCLGGRSTVPEFEEHRAVFAGAAGTGP
jgi:sarcosine oxidase